MNRAAAIRPTAAALLILMLLCTARAGAQDTAIGDPVSLPPRPAPPVLYYSTGGQLRASWEGGGTLHEALGVRPLFPAPLICRASPCAPAVDPGAALIVADGSGGESEAAIVPPRSWRVWAPLVGR